MVSYTIIYMYSSLADNIQSHYISQHYVRFRIHSYSRQQW